jgi:hypothetical protein
MSEKTLKTLPMTPEQVREHTKKILEKIQRFRDMGIVDDEFEKMHGPESIIKKETDEPSI